MSTDNPSPRDRDLGEPLPSTEPDTDEGAGVPCAMISTEPKPKEVDVVVEQFDGMVVLSLRSRAIRGRVFLEGESAAALAEDLDVAVSAAEEATTNEEVEQ